MNLNIRHKIIKISVGSNLFSGVEFWVFWRVHSGGLKFNFGSRIWVQKGEVWYLVLGSCRPISDLISSKLWLFGWFWKHTEFFANKTQNFFSQKSIAIGLTWRFSHEFRKTNLKFFIFDFGENFFWQGENSPIEVNFYVIGKIFVNIESGNNQPTLVYAHI